HAVLDLVFEPPAPGRYHIEVKSRRPRDGETSYDDTTLVYDLTVQPSDALGTLLLRGPAGHVYAIHGSERRHVPDLETLQALGFSLGDTAPASASVIESLPEGAPLPKLRDGILVRANNHGGVFRLHGGKRVWQRSYSPDSREYGGAEEVSTIESAVLGAIVPVLQNDMLLKGNATDVYHVDRGALRKVPDWKWITERRLNPADIFFVPDRIIATLPQTSPHWVMPGGAWQDQAFYSQTLGREMPHRVYLPPDYAAEDRSGQRYPVLYLLHGMGGRYDEWSGYGVEEVANQLLSEGKFAHTIIVMPQGGLGYWMEQEGGTNWGDYVARDVVAHIDATYRTVARREARAIGGLSMGAHGALQLSLNHSDVFGIAGAHSPSIRTAESAPAFMGKGDGFARRDPISLVENGQIANPPQIWIDTGTNDSWRPSAEAIHQALVDRGWAHEWHVYPGEHDGWYWGDHIWDYLPYYSTAFEKNGIPVLKAPLRERVG
ncbi:MAG TPA: alpha/beta hydrolase-fold protein, partial [Chloroflexota bacterium]|nr:alpha/beta hydrolase-fold protein [Chloroflexota bacterium]